jgi:hypothetical protein
VAYVDRLTLEKEQTNYKDIGCLVDGLKATGFLKQLEPSIKRKFETLKK